MALTTNWDLIGDGAHMAAIERERWEDEHANDIPSGIGFMYQQELYDKMEELVRIYGNCRFVKLELYHIVVTFLGKYTAKVDDDGKVEWITEPPPDP